MTYFESIILPEARVMKVNFEGNFDISQCHSLISEMPGEFARQAENDWIFVWDCRDMTGFDQSAKKSWIDFLEQTRSKIDKVVVISDNMVIRGAARLILRMFGFPCQVLKNDFEMSKLTKMEYKLAS